MIARGDLGVETPIERLGEIYPDISQDEEGLRKRFNQFSFPGGIASHVSPECPGSIHVPLSDPAGHPEHLELLEEWPIAHKQYSEKHGQDLPEGRNWKWGATHE
jgi:phosphoketolase